MDNVNIKQITNFDIKNLESFEIDNIEYCQYIFSIPAKKIGYCCDIEGINIPIYIFLESQPTTPIKINIGKTGIYELQPDIFFLRDYTQDEITTQEINVNVDIIKIFLPKKINFVLDFILIL